MDTQENWHQVPGLSDGETTAPQKLSMRFYILRDGLLHVDEYIQEVGLANLSRSNLCRSRHRLHSGHNHLGGESYEDIFCTHCQHLHMGQRKDLPSLLSLALAEKALLLLPQVRGYGPHRSGLPLLPTLIG